MGRERPIVYYCQEDVWPQRAGRPHRCNNKAKHDPDRDGIPTKCGVHSEEAKKRRRAVRRRKLWERL